MDVDRRGFLSGVTVLAGGALGAETVGAQPGDGASPDWLPPTGSGAREGDGRRLARATSSASASWSSGSRRWRAPRSTGASATGRRARRGLARRQQQIAEFLLANGAQPTIFSAAMLGQLDVVKAFVAARPGIQRTLGPHGITLLAHARAGGPVPRRWCSSSSRSATPITDPRSRPLAPAIATLLWEVRLRSRTARKVTIDVNRIVRAISSASTVRRHVRRLLLHTGGLVFFLLGVPSAKIAFAKGKRDGSHSSTLADPNVMLTAKRA